ncbi:MAG: primosomal protein N' [Clostridia bacterium]|nr:primosomal protein N' [Clostridia bacterium]
MIARVIVDVLASEVDRIFDYEVPVQLNVEVGHRVLVPFGVKKIEGYVIELTSTSEYEISKLKQIICILDEVPIIKKEMISLMDFMCYKYHLRKIDVLRLCIPSQLRGGKVKPLTRQAISLVDIDKANEFINNATARQENQANVLRFLIENKTAFIKDLSNQFPISAINKLKELNLVNVYDENIKRTPNVVVKQDKKVELTTLQKDAVNIINNSNGEVVLLFGVTGSGKTEVYMHSIDKVLKEGKSAIMLVPEISLTPQVHSNFKARFGDNVAVLHSGLSAGERFDEWQKLLKGEARIAVGARSAIFAPLENLGLIIIDEEHDSSYTSDSNPRYNTIDIATFRGKFNNCPVVLGSATPSIESYYNAQIGKYRLAKLPVRANNKRLPTMYSVSLYDAIMQGDYKAISNFLCGKLNKAIEENKQSIVFLNRRGYVSFLRCSKCGYTPTCTDCEVSLVHHKEDNMLKCHFCDKRYRVITKCPECGSEALRNGAMGTQKIVDDLKTLFPNVPIFRLDNDTTTTKDSYQKILNEFESTAPSILVGTQMIAKGHDFPLVTLVGIVDADIGLHQSDFRASERCFQLVTQVAGRAGRSEFEGEVVLQSFKPKHYVYRFANNYDYEGFYKREIEIRRTTHFPPFASIVRVLVSCEDEQLCKETAQSIFRQVVEIKEKYFNDFIFCKGVACPVKRIKTKYRYEVIMRLKNDHFDEIIQQIYQIADKSKNKRVLIFVETNPQNLS